MSSQTTGKKKREANIEILRIIAMLMIIVLHYLGKSNSLILYDYWDSVNIPKFNIAIAWTLEAFSYGATNIYVLICGYFLIDTPFKVEKGIKLWLQIFFYSAGIALIFLLSGNYPDTHWGIFWLGKFCLPIVSKHYWFASIYVFLFLLAPFLSVVVHKISKKNLLSLIGVMFLLFSRLWHDLLPFTEPIEDRGMGIGWFVTVFLIAAYIRLYVKKGKNKVKYLISYIGASLLTVLSLYLISYFAIITGKLGTFSSIAYNYNSVLITLASVSLFLFFREIKIREGIISKLICKVASLTFGIYLIHEHTFLRGCWISVWHADEHFFDKSFIPNLLFSVIIVFVGCALIEFLRQCLFNLIYKLKPVKYIFDKLSILDSFFSMCDK